LKLKKSQRFRTRGDGVRRRPLHEKKDSAVPSPSCRWTTNLIRNAPKSKKDFGQKEGLAIVEESTRSTERERLWGAENPATV